MTGTASLSRDFQPVIEIRAETLPLLTPVNLAMTLNARSPPQKIAEYFFLCAEAAG